MAKIGVKIMPRQVILDTQGRAVERTLKTQTDSLLECRVGRYVELTFAELSDEDALKEAHKSAKFVLYNPLIEDYELIPLKDS